MRLPHSTFSLQERYESAYIAVCGDLKKPMRIKQITCFLESLFPSFPYRFSSYNIAEVLQNFGRDGLKSKILFWSDIRKGLKEHKREQTYFSRLVFVNFTLNPEATALKTWQKLQVVIGLYYFLVIPIRISFDLWESMLDIRALCSDLAMDVWTIINFIIHANTAYMGSKATWVIDRSKILRRVNPCIAIPAIPFDW